MTSYSGLKYEYCEGMDSDKIKLDMHFGNGNYYFQETIGNFEINGIKARGTIESCFKRYISRRNEYIFIPAGMKVLSVIGFR